MDKQRFTIGPDESIEAALKKIDVNLRRGLIVVENEKAVGTITDGDIRKAVLSHRLLITPVRDIMNTNFFRVSVDSSENLEKVFSKKGIFLIPVVDDDMNLIDIVIRGP